MSDQPLQATGANPDGGLSQISAADIERRNELLEASVAAQLRHDTAKMAKDKESTDLLTNRLPIDATPARVDLVVRLLAEACNSHSQCRPTCFKYDKNKCRFRFPRPVVSHTWFDDQTCTLNVRRDARSTTLNGFNRTVLLATRANHDVRSIVFSSAGPAYAFYITKYISKPSGVQLAHNAAVHAAGAVARQRARQSTDSDAVRRASGVLLSLVSTSVSEVPAVAASYSMLNHVCFVLSCAFRERSL